MVENNFLIVVCRDVFIFEFAIEISVNGRHRLVFGEDEGERDVLIVLRNALLRETFRAKDFSIGVGGMPRSKEYVMLL